MIYDVAIIGAGPCGLATAARLRERTPSALFTDDEHARYWNKHNQSANSLETEYRKRKGSIDSGYQSETGTRIHDHDISANQPSMIVLDAESNQWMTMWKKRFSDLRISHLRSPLFFHPDPRDRDGLLAFAHETNRMNRLQIIPNVVGKELSKHEKKKARSRKQARTTVRHLKVDGRDQVDYYTPSTELFDDYCKYIIERYDLEGLVQQARVTDIEYGQILASSADDLFSITTSEHDQVYARTVVIATGGSSKPIIPNFQRLNPPAQQNGSITHVFQPRGTSLPTRIEHGLSTGSLQPVTILVIGGGLTSAQYIHLILSQHQSAAIHVHLLLRHDRLKCKPFDVSLPWVTKTRNHLMSTFWSADTDEERLTMLKTARNGGSVNEPFAKTLQRHVASGRLTIHTNTELVLDDTCVWDKSLRKWTFLNIESPSRASTGVDLLFPNGIDHIVHCTGVTSNFEKIPFLQTIRERSLAHSIGGLPILNEDLMISDDIPCFFTGALAGLRLGPGAANLAGARQGAERIAWAISRIIDRQIGSRDGISMSKNVVHRGDAKATGVNDFAGSFQNWYEILDTAN